MKGVKAGILLALMVFAYSCKGAPIEKRSEAQRGIELAKKVGAEQYAVEELGRSQEAYDKASALITEGKKTSSNGKASAILDESIQKSKEAYNKSLVPYVQGLLENAQNTVDSLTGTLVEEKDSAGLDDLRKLVEDVKRLSGGTSKTDEAKSEATPDNDMKAYATINAGESEVAPEGLVSSEGQEKIAALEESVAGYKSLVDNIEGIKAKQDNYRALEKAKEGQNDSNFETVKQAVEGAVKAKDGEQLLKALADSDGLYQQMMDAQKKAESDQKEEESQKEDQSQRVAAQKEIDDAKAFYDRVQGLWKNIKEGKDVEQSAKDLDDVVDSSSEDGKYVNPKQDEGK